MRRFRLLLPTLAFLLVPRAAAAAEPPDPFRVGRGASGSAVSDLPDPFGRPPAPASSRSPLKDPFSVRAPACPVRTTDTGVVVQRPAGSVCAPVRAGLPDPWAGEPVS